MDTLSLDDLRAVSLHAHQAAGDTVAWGSVSERLAHLFQADGAVVFTPPTPSSPVLLWADSGASTSSRQAYTTRWWTKDPWRLEHERQRQVVTEGFVMLGRQLVSREHLERTEFYTDFGRVHDVCDVVALCIDDDYEQGPRVHLSLVRGDKRPAFDATIERHLRVLQPMLRGAVRSHWAMQGTRNAGEAVEGTLDALPKAALLLSADYRVLYANRVAALHMQSQTRPIGVSGNRLVVLGQYDVSDLSRLVASAMRGLTHSLPLHWSDATGVHRSTVYLARLDERTAHSIYANAILVIVDSISPAADRARRLDEFCALHRVSTAQKAILIHVATGVTVEVAADRCGVSINTARTHVRRLLVRTGESSLADLVRRVAP
jgi:DNA-binding CsgD family transcriptional regulator